LNFFCSDLPIFTAAYSLLFFFLLIRKKLRKVSCVKRSICRCLLIFEMFIHIVTKQYDMGCAPKLKHADSSSKFYLSVNNEISFSSLCISVSFSVFSIIPTKENMNVGCRIYKTSKKILHETWPNHRNYGSIFFLFKKHLS
jgi:hypothetical protein